MFIALADDETHDGPKPHLTHALIALNVFAYVIELLVGEPAVMTYGLIPHEIMTGTDLIGVVQTQVDGKTFEVKHYPVPLTPYLTLFSSMFLHGSIFHLLGNMLYLYIFGDQLEVRLGKTRYLVFYLLSGLIAGLAHVLMNQSSIGPLIGASGAVAGVLGGYFVLHPMNSVRVMIFFFVTSMPAWAFLGLWMVSQTISQIWAVNDHVAYIAHIAGFITGLILIASLIYWAYIVRRRGETLKEIRRAPLSLRT